MHLWIINPYAITPNMAGMTRHYSLARVLKQYGIDVTIITSDVHYLTRRSARSYGAAPYHFEEIEGVSFLWIDVPGYTLNSWGRVKSMLAFAARVYRKAWAVSMDEPDVVLASSPHMFGAWAAARLARVYEVPFILEVRDLWPESLVQIGGYVPGHPAVRLLEYLERYLYRKADAIVTLLPGASDHFIEKGAQPDQIHWIPNGVDLNLIDQPVFPHQPGPFTVMYAGAHGIANALDAVLDAAALLAQEAPDLDVQFRLIGDGVEKCRLAQRVEDERLYNVQLEPPVPKAAIYKKLSAADAFIVNMKRSSLYRHGISFNKLFDYMAVARPVVFASNAPNNPIAEADAGVTVEADNPRSLADGVRQLARMSAQERWQMGLRGRRYVEQGYNMTVLGQRLKTVLEAATGSKIAVEKSVPGDAA